MFNNVLEKIIINIFYFALKMKWNSWRKEINRIIKIISNNNINFQFLHSF